MLIKANVKIIWRDLVNTIHFSLLALPKNIRKIAKSKYIVHQAVVVNMNSTCSIVCVSLSSTNYFTIFEIIKTD